MNRIFGFVFFVILNDDLLIKATFINERGSPLAVITWDYQDATQKAWQILHDENGSALDAIEGACTLCEERQCRTTVGYGGSPDEEGETTLDAMIMDGVTMDVGAVGGLRNIKSAIKVARRVLENTKHSLLGGDLATKFAIEMGFRNESLTTNFSHGMWEEWRANNCQPNFWKNVSPDPLKFCGPYTNVKSSIRSLQTTHFPNSDENNHDTIGVVVLDSRGHIAAGTSTNGAKFKIPGRIGDSPIPGAGAYADQEIGAAAATGDGDIMMRFLPSFLAVEEMRRGSTPEEAAKVAIRRIVKHYPTFVGGIIALDKNGNYGAACNGIPTFPYYVVNEIFAKPTMKLVHCTNFVRNIHYAKSMKILYPSVTIIP